jgi:PIN domain nuclease of toxin-antitoxin system
MKLLLDTHILLWATASPDRLPKKVLALINDAHNELFYSAASIWEIVIINSLGRKDFRIDPRLFRAALEDHGYQQIPITCEHVLLVQGLPPLHKDPFDRLLVAQASVEGMGLLTLDQAVIDYGGTVILDGERG